MIANKLRQRAVFQRIQFLLQVGKAHLYLLKFYLLRRLLGLKILALSQCIKMGLSHNAKLLAKDRGRAVFVDKFFQKMKHRASRPSSRCWAYIGRRSDHD